MTIEWDAPSHVGGVALLAYEVWFDNGAGDFSSISAPVAIPGPADTQLAVTSLTNGVTSGIKMRAVNEVGAGEFSDIVYLICAAKPGTPAAPTSDAATRSSITVAWNEPSATAQATVTGYSLYINDLSVGDWRRAYSGLGYPTRQVATITNLTVGQSYRFKISAHNAVGASLNSSEATFIASDFPEAPSQPARLNSTASEVAIAWQPPTDNGGEIIGYYEVHHKLASEAESAWALVANISDINTLEFLHTGLSAAVDVQYKVRAKTNKGYGPFSIRNTFVLAAAPTITAAPAKVQSTRNSITAEWLFSSEGGSPITGYRLYQTYVRTGAETLIYDGSNQPTVSSMQVEGLLEGEWYKYRVSAINRVGEGALSPLSVAMISAQVPARSAIPTFLSATSTTITLGLQPTSDNGGSAVTAYNVYATAATSDGASSETYTKVASYDGLSMQFVLDNSAETSFATGQIYRFSFSATNIIGRSSQQLGHNRLGGGCRDSNCPSSQPRAKHEDLSLHHMGSGGSCGRLSYRRLHAQCDEAGHRHIDVRLQRLSKQREAVLQRDRAGNCATIRVQRDVSELQWSQPAEPRAPSHSLRATDWVCEASLQHIHGLISDFGLGPSV